MDAKTFHALVNSLEQQAKRAPDALRKRIRLLVALGYGYVLGLLGIVVGLNVALIVTVISTGRLGVMWKPIAALIVVAYVIVKALWVRIDPPTGETITAKQAPKLFQRVEAIRAAVQAPKPDVVLLTDDFNASVTQVPIFGVFGGHRTYLILGLPLMYALTPRQFDAVVGHEFGHLSGAHPKFGLWVLRVQVVWGQLMRRLAEDGALAGKLVVPFGEWYMPRLTAHGYALRREDEHAADRDGARVSDAKAMGEALAALEVRGAFYGEYWSSLTRRIEFEPTPPTQTWTALPGFLASVDQEPSAVSRLADALQRENLIEDSHPVLRLRLAAMQLMPAGSTTAEELFPALVPPLDATAAEHYLGSLASQRLMDWEREWQKANATPWAEVHRARAGTREKVNATLARVSAGETLQADEMWTLALGLDQLEGVATAEPWCERIIAVDTRHAGAHYLLGEAKLARGDADGEALLRNFHASRGDSASAARVDSEADLHFKRYEQAAREQTLIERDANFMKAALSEDDVNALQKAAALPGVGTLYVARRIRTHEVGPPQIVVLVEPKNKLGTSMGDARSKLATEVIESLLADGREYFVTPWDDNAGWLKDKIKGARGYRVTASGVSNLG
jgi:Zn-dependent protease with chaperone function